MLYMWRYDSPLGAMALVSQGEALEGLYFVGQRYFPSLVGAVEERLSIFASTSKWLDLYFQGKEPERLPQFVLTGSEFRLLVWRKLLSIPYGTVTTYGAIARSIASEKGVARYSAQAVGAAVGHNHLSIIVPCHRVVGAKGDLIGYAGGIERKAALLRLEGYDPHNKCGEKGVI